MSRKKVRIWTDGACTGNPGPGGFAALLRFGNAEGTRSGGHPATTNNQMELMAAIVALESLSEPCDVEITTDSRYVMDGISKWIKGWKRNGWKTSSRKAVKNVELWKRLDTARERHDVQWHWVRGHTGHRENEAADKLAGEAIAALRSRRAVAVDLSEHPADPEAGIRRTSSRGSAKKKHRQAQ